MPVLSFYLGKLNVVLNKDVLTFLRFNECYVMLCYVIYILTANSIIVRAFLEIPGSVHRFVTNEINIINGAYQLISILSQRSLLSNLSECR